MINGMKEQYIAPVIEITEFPEVKTDSLSEWNLKLNSSWYNS